jgi:hypothetical protein
MNGHMVNGATRQRPGNNQAFCEKCGQKTITQCPHCNKNIKGDHWLSGRHRMGVTSPATVTAFCQYCGKAFPWTESRIAAAKTLADETEGIDSQEKELLKEAIDDIVRDTPQTIVATSRFKKIMTKAGKETTQAFRAILVDVLSEAVKKAIWPDL